MNESFVTLECRQETLAAILHLPDAAIKKGIGVVIVVGGPQYRVGSHRQFVLTARALAGAGYPVLRFDYRGMGDSQGMQRGFESVDDDIAAAVAALCKHAAVSEVVLYGLCDAASAAMMYVESRNEPVIRGLALANPWVRTEAGEARAYVEHYYARRLLQRSFWQKLLTGQLNVAKAVGSLLRTISSMGGGTGANQPSGHFTERMLTGLGAFTRPVFLAMSGRDLTAREFQTFVLGSAVWRSALERPSVTRREFDTADHTFSVRADLDAANRALQDWLATLDKHP